MHRTAKRLLIATAMSLAVAGVTAAPAHSWVSPGMNTEYPSAGGTWEYGFSNVKLRSYYTVNTCHRSTVYRYIDGSLTDTDYSINTASGQTSIAEIGTVNSPGLEAEYFYSTSC